MSHWTYVNGIITLETCARSDAEAMYLAQTTVNHLPRVTGSEGPVEFYFLRPNGHNFSSNVDEFGQDSNLWNARDHWFETQSEILLVLQGALRDRDLAQTLRETTRMLTRLASRLWVKECLVAVKDDQGKRFLFDSPGFLVDAQLKQWKLDKSPPVLNGGLFRFPVDWS